MSIEALSKLIDDASKDAHLWERLMEWPQEVMDEYSLSEDEVDALRSGNLQLLKEMGVDEIHLHRAGHVAAKASPGRTL